MLGPEPLPIDPDKLARAPYLILSPDPMDVFQEMVASLATLDREKTIFWCARLNLLRMHFPRSDFGAFDRAFAARFFSSQELRTMYRALKRAHRPRRNYLACFDRRPLLEVMRWAALLGRDLAGAGSELNLEEGHHLFNAARCAEFDAFRRSFIAHHEPYVDLPDRANVAMNSDLPVWAYHWSLRYVVDQDQCILGRSAIFLREELFSATPELKSRFERSCGLSLDAWLGCVLLSKRLTTGDLAPDPIVDLAGFGVIDQPRPGTFGAQTLEVMNHFLSRESQDADELRAGLLSRLPDQTISEATPFDTTPLRMRPFIRGASGQIILCDRNFLDDKLWLGPVFQLLADGFNAKFLFGQFGEAVERYVRQLIGSLVKRAGPGRYDAVYYNPRANPGRVEITDVCLRCGETLVMIECKSAWLPQRFQWEHGEGAYKEAIQSRFAQAGEGSKGVGQLARSVVGLADGSLVPHDAALTERITRVLPIVLVQEQTVAAPMFPQFLAEEFESFVRTACKEAPAEKDGWLNIGNLRTSRPTTITLSDLEALESTYRIPGWLNSSFRSTRAIRIASSHFIFSLMLRPSCCPTLGSIPRHYLGPREKN
jgi:hypothetical protein